MLPNMKILIIWLLILLNFTGHWTKESHLKSWKLLEQFVSSSLNHLINSSSVLSLRRVLEENRSSSRECVEAIEDYIESIAKLDYWAVKMFDSSGKIPSGILDGTVNDMGAYDQCLDVTNASYCLIDMNIEMPERDPYHSIVTTIGEQFSDFSHEGKVFHHLTQLNAQYFHYIYYRLGICLPSVCNESNVRPVITSVLTKSQIGLNLKNVQCQIKTTLTEELRMLNAYQIFSIVYLSSLVVLSVVGSTNHMLFGRDLGKQTMTCLQGLRFFSIIWVILGHCYGWISFQIFRRSFAASGIVSSFWFQPVMHGSLAVDTFFMISGFLALHVSIIQYNSTKSFNILIYILHRIFRFLPHVLLILSVTFLSPLFGSGPIWHETIDPVVQSCQKNWWTNILFVNHLVDSKNICLLHTWYLGCDLHFYILSLIVIIPFIYGYKKLSLINTSLFIIIGVIITGFIIGTNQYPPTLLFSQPKVEERLSYVLDFYIKPFTHSGSYGIGLLLALIIAWMRNEPKLKQFAMQPKIMTFGWILSIITITCLLFSVYPWNNGSKPDPIIAIIYGSLHRTLWSAAFAWIVFACLQEKGGLVNKILSFRPLIPLSRLTFSVYLVHPVIHWVKLGSIRERIAVSHLDGIYAFIPTVVLSFFFGLICTLLCESPLLAIEKRFLKYYHKDVKYKSH